MEGGEGSGGREGWNRRKRRMDLRDERWERREGWKDEGKGKRDGRMKGRERGMEG